MPNGQGWPQRRSIRLGGFDYAGAGAYFVTVCVQHRVCLFGSVIDDEVRLNEAGETILDRWTRLPSRYARIEVDAVVVMPNHVHGIIMVNHDDDWRGEPRPVLGDIVGWFKTMTTNEYIRGVRERGWEPFPGRLWQRNYYEYIIRNERAHERIRAYIAANPSRWPFDEENPGRTITR
ncbi:MAG: transposase [Chloroflexia bacterium]|nr:transposase [Chloroflexia bacterium]